MKKLVIMFVAIVCASAAIAQSKTVEDFQNKYKDDRDAKVVSVNGGLFHLLAEITSWDESDEEAMAFSRIAENIKGVKIVAIPLYKSGFGHNEIDQMLEDLKKENYEELMTAKEGDERFYFLTQGSKDAIKNMLVLVREDDEFAVISVDGTMQMKDLSFFIKHHKDWH
ncbi:MAG: DUF4252 domain-containing protein [Fulvivirga sp.]|nr:DUF4252 domain-containing protein [Fulvivirga sp.]